MDLILAADPGTTATKVAVVNDRGAVLASREAVNPILRPEPGAAEHDPEALWRTFAALCRSLPARLRERVSAVTLAGYQLSLMALDARGRPLTGIMTLLDGRSQESFGTLTRRCDMRRLYRRTGCPPVAQYPLAKAWWLKTRRPAVFRRTTTFLGGKDWVLSRLAGRLVTEPSVSSATQLLGLRTGEWDPYALRVLGLDARRLPAVVPAERVLGPLDAKARRETGLPASAVLVPGVYDAAATLLGIGGMTPGVGAINLGTSAMYRTVIRRPALDRTRWMRLQTYHLIRGLWLGGAGVNNAGNVRAWLVRLFGLQDERALDALAARVPPGADGALGLPFLTGDRDPRIGGDAAGAFLRLRERHGAGHLARAATEGICYKLRMVGDLMREHGMRVHAVRAGGGGTNSRLWVQTLADVLNAPVQLTETPHPSLVGTAMVALVATGRFPSLAEASRRMVRLGRVVRPDRRRAALYDEGMKRFAAACLGVA